MKWNEEFFFLTFFFLEFNFGFHFLIHHFFFFLLKIMSEEQKQVKLPYFHRTLSPEEMNLIGDITPKKIETPASTAPVTAPTGSAWNTANTWEEKNCTSKCKKILEDIFEGHDSFTAFNITDGNSSINFIRGKARFMYDFSYKFDFNAKGCEGSVEVSDVINDQLDDIVYQFKWKVGNGLTPEGKELKKYVNSEVLSLMKKFEEKFAAIHQ